jgi:hypothetical protein
VTDVAAVAPPDTSVWWDPASVTAAALAQLRLTDGDVDAGRVGSAVDPAGQMINQYLDRDPVDAYDAVTVPAQVAAEQVQVVIRMYRAKDQPAASLDGMMLTAPPLIDPLTGSRRALDPFRKRRGIG